MLLMISQTDKAKRPRQMTRAQWMDSLTVLPRRKRNDIRAEPIAVMHVHEPDAK
jgi:hypothetical protein